MTLQVVPVMDVMDAQVVRGVGGRRDEYRPVQSVLCNDARPQTVARAFVELGFRQAYLADLDAIAPSQRTTAERNRFSTDIYREVMHCGIDLWIDAGLASDNDARELASLRFDGRPIAGIVAGLESLDGPRALAEMVRAVDTQRLIFSLDMKHGQPVARSAAWRHLSATQIGQLALRLGVGRMIVLDLASVGVGCGVNTLPLCRTLRGMEPALQLIAGGGVRGPADLDALARAGCDAALVASALHDGRIGAAAFSQRGGFTNSTVRR